MIFLWIMENRDPYILYTGKGYVLRDLLLCYYKLVQFRVYSSPGLSRRREQTEKAHVPWLVTVLTCVSSPWSSNLKACCRLTLSKNFGTVWGADQLQIIIGWWFLFVGQLLLVRDDVSEQVLDRHQQVFRV